jgi:hypothetical protein
MLSHSGSLGIMNHLLNVGLLPFGCIISEDRELMQLKTVLESSPPAWMPLYDHLTIYSSPQVMLVHLVANIIPSGLQTSGQEVPQLLLRLGNCLVVLLMGFLEHLLGLFDL